MEFLNINITKDSSLSLRAVHSPFYLRIFKKTILYSGFNNILKNGKVRVENQTKTRVWEYSSLCSETSTKNGVQDFHLWIRIPNPDTDPLTWLNPDTNSKYCWKPGKKMLLCPYQEYIPVGGVPSASRLDAWRSVRLGPATGQESTATRQTITIITLKIPVSRASVVDPDSLNSEPDPTFQEWIRIRIQVLMIKNWRNKKYSWKFLKSFLIKNCDVLIPRPS